MKIKTIFLFGIIFILCLTLLLGLCSCDGETPDTESTGNTSESTDLEMPDWNDIFSFPEGGIELPEDEFE